LKELKYSYRCSTSPFYMNLWISCDWLFLLHVVRFCWD
jgi:hypothetical protein